MLYEDELLGMETEEDDFLFEEEQLDFLELSLRRLSTRSFLTKCLTVLSVVAAILCLPYFAGPLLCAASIGICASLWILDAWLGHTRKLHSALYEDVLHDGTPAKDISLKALGARFPQPDNTFSASLRDTAWFYLPFVLTAILITLFRDAVL